MISDEDVRQLLRRSWGLADGSHVARHDGGMGSQTWIVSQGERRWVAKSVAPHLADSFAHGLQVARMLDDAGIRSGAPVPARSGSMTVDTASGDRVALLTWVPGSPLTGTDEAEQRLIGDTLARVHRVLQNARFGCSASTGLTWRQRIGTAPVAPTRRHCGGGRTEGSEEPRASVAARTTARRSRSRGLPARPGVRSMRHHRLELGAARPVAVRPGLRRHVPGRTDLRRCYDQRLPGGGPSHRPGDCRRPARNAPASDGPYKPTTSPGA